VTFTARRLVVDLEVRFFRMTNGARIAYTSIGSGPPLVVMPAAVTHLQILWEGPSVADQYRSLAEAFTVIWYDRWGMGLSDRKRDDWTLAAEVDTLAQLADHLGLETAAIWGISGGGPACIKYAAANPSRVSRLILYATHLMRHDIDPAWLAGLAEFVRGTWNMGAGALAEVLVPNSPPEVKAWFLRLCREGSDGESWAKSVDMELLADVRAEATRITSPTLVLHRREDPGVPLSSASSWLRGFPALASCPSRATSICGCWAILALSFRRSRSSPARSRRRRQPFRSPERLLFRRSSLATSKDTPP
jgi:pimeloyl-ACP methyl ester carboxylesterase